MSAKQRGSDVVTCPRCGGLNIWRSGFSRAKKQQYKCRGCDRTFVLNPYLNGLVVEIADRMLEEELPVPVVAKILTGHVSKRWLYNRRSEICLTRS